MKILHISAGLAALALAVSVQAQKSAADGMAEYRKMLEEGNPADLFEAKGEGLWKQKRGPKNASLERCDRGQGPGVVKGVLFHLPCCLAATGRGDGTGAAGGTTSGTNQPRSASSGPRVSAE